MLDFYFYLLVTYDIKVSLWLYYLSNEDDDFSIVHIKEMINMNMSDAVVK